MIDCIKQQISANFGTVLQDRSSCMIPVQPNPTLPLRPAPPAPVRNRSIKRLMKDGVYAKRAAFQTADGHDKIDDDAALPNKIANYSESDNASFINNQVHDLRFPTILSTESTEMCDNTKRKYDSLGSDNCVQSLKNKHSKYEMLKKRNEINEKRNDSVDSEDMMCIKKVELQTDSNEYSVTSNVKLDKDSLKVVPPLRLKKVIQEVTIDQQEHLTDNNHFTSEIETSNYQIISGTTPIQDSTKVLVSTTLTSNTTSFMPKSYIDNIRITIPSLPELGIQESYEITGPNFIATMTSKITNTGTHASKLWQSSKTHRPVWTRKYKDKTDKSSNSSIKILEHNIIDPNSTAEFTITSSDNITPTINLSKTYEILKQIPNDLSLKVLQKDDEIKLEQIINEALDKCDNENYDEINYINENLEADKDVQEYVIHKSDDSCLSDDSIFNNELVINNNEDEVNYDINCFKYRRSQLQLKLNELKNKAIRLKQKADNDDRILYQQTIDFYEKQIEVLSKLMNKLSSSDLDLQFIESKQFEDVKNFEDVKKPPRSPSLSPPKLSPTSPVSFKRIKSPSEIRNSPPILSISGELEAMNKSENIDSDKSHVLDISYEKCNELIESISSPLIDSIFIKDEEDSQMYRPTIEMHDDECVEITLLMKPMSYTVEKNDGNDYENYASCVKQDSVASKDQGSESVENNKVPNKLLSNQEESDNNLIILDEQTPASTPKQLDSIILDNLDSDASFLPSSKQIFTLSKQNDSKSSVNDSPILTDVIYNCPVDLTVSTTKVSDSVNMSQPLQANVSSKSTTNSQSKNSISKETTINSSYVMSGSTMSIIDTSKAIERPKIVSDNVGFPMKPPQSVTINQNHSGSIIPSQNQQVSQSEAVANSSNIYGPSNLNQIPAACPIVCNADANSAAKFNTPTTSVLSALLAGQTTYEGKDCTFSYFMNDMQGKHVAARSNDGYSRINVTKNFNEPAVIANHQSRAVNQSRSTVTQNLQTPRINNNISPTKSTSENNDISNRIATEQFPIFGNWVSKMNYKNSVKHKRKSNAEQTANANNQATSMQNADTTRSNYAMGNVTYYPRWNTDRPLERQPSMQHLESLPIQNSALNVRQRSFSAAPIPRFYPADYTIYPYAAMYGYNATYPYGSNLSYAPIQPVSTLEMQRMPYEGIRGIQYPPPTILQQADKRIPHITGYRNITEFVRIPNTLPPTTLERHPNLHNDNLRATYNNCGLLMEPQYPRPVYKKTNVNQYEIEQTNFSVDNPKKSVDDMFIQSRLLREPIVMVGSKNKYYSDHYRPVSHETNTIRTNGAMINSSSSSMSIVNNSTSYTVNSDRMQLPIRDVDPVSRTCETPNLGKITSSPNSSQKLKCFNCGAMNSLFQCLGCEIAVYCNEICQTQHWTEHVSKCPKIMPKLKKVV